MIPIIILLLLVGGFAFWGLWRLTIHVLQNLGREKFTVTTTAEGVIQKKDLNQHKYCVSIRESMEYRIGVNGAITDYFFYKPDSAYLGWLLPHKNDPNEQWLIITVPKNDTEGSELQTYLANHPLHVVLTDKEIKELVDIGQEGFDITEHMNFWQKWCWNYAKVYWFWEPWTKKQLEFRPFINSKIIPGKDGGEPTYEHREELSANFAANDFPYGKVMRSVEDKNNIPLDLDFSVTGRNDNPYYSDFQEANVFTQLDLKIRKAVNQSVRQNAYLAKSTQLEKRMREFQQFETALRQVSPEVEFKLELPKQADTTESSTQYLIQVLKDTVLEVLNDPDNYLGFVWTDVDIIQIRPPQNILDKQTQIVESELAAEVSINETFAERAKGIAQNDVELDKKKKEADAEAYEIEKRSKSEAEAIQRIAEAKKKEGDFIETLVKALGSSDRALQYLELKAKYEAFGKDGTQLYVGLSNPEQGLLMQGNKILTELSKKG